MNGECCTYNARTRLNGRLPDVIPKAVIAVTVAKVVCYTCTMAPESTAPPMATLACNECPLHVKRCTRIAQVTRMKIGGSRPKDRSQKSRSKINAW